MAQDPITPPFSQLFFLHIPKTGGTSFVAHLQRDFFPHETLEVDANTAALPALLDGTVSKYRVVAGHQFYPFATALRPPRLIVSVLRDPFMRVVSAYEYVVRTPSHPLFQRFASDGGTRSLKQVLRDPTLAFHFENMQTRMLGATYDLRALLRAVESGTMELDEAQQTIRRAESRSCDIHTYRRAVARLQRMFFVGLMEHFELSVLRFAYALGLPFPGALVHEKAAPLQSAERRLDAYDADTRQLVDVTNQFDQRLYRCAIRRFNLPVEPSLTQRCLDSLDAQAAEPWAAN